MKANATELRAMEKLDDLNGTFREAAFGALVVLARKRSGGTTLFGDSTELAFTAYRRSLIGRSFPSFWMAREVVLEYGVASGDRHESLKRDNSTLLPTVRRCLTADDAPSAPTSVP